MTFRGDGLGQAGLPDAGLPSAGLPSAGLPNARLGAPGRDRSETSASTHLARAAVFILVVLLLHRLVLALDPDGGSGVRPIDRRPWSLDPPSGTRTTSAFTMIVDIDESGSTQRSDKDNNRTLEVQLLRRWLDLWGAPDDELSIVRFADRPLGWGPTPVRETPVDLPAGDPGTGTAFAPAIDDAGARFATSANQRRVLVLLTDGEGDDPRPSLAALPADTQTFVLGLDDDHMWSRVSTKQWADVTTGAWSLQNLSRAEVIKPLAQLLSRLTGQTVTASVKRSLP